VRVDVVRALADLGDAKSRGALHRQLDRDLDGRVRRRIREVLRDLGGAGKRESDRLKDELEALRNEHNELKVRIGKLEAQAQPASEGKKGARKSARKSAQKAASKGRAPARKAAKAKKRG
jgi:aminopeptidase N